MGVSTRAIMPQAQVSIENYNDHQMWLRFIYASAQDDSGRKWQEFVVSGMTALAITLPQGANEIQWMDWSSDEPGSASQWSPQGSKPFTTNGGEQMKFEPGMDTGGGAPAPAADDDDGDDSGPGDTVVVELANNLDSAVWFKFIYGGGASAEASIGQGALALSVPGNMQKIQFTEWSSNSTGTASEWNAQLSAGKVSEVKYRWTPSNKSFDFGEPKASFEELHPTVVVEFRNMIPGKHIWIKINYDRNPHAVQQVFAPGAFTDLSLPGNALDMEWKEWDSPQPGSDADFAGAVSKPFKGQDGEKMKFDIEVEPEGPPTHIPDTLKVDLNMDGSEDDDILGIAPDLGRNFQEFKRSLQASGNKFVDPGFEMKTHIPYPGATWRRPAQCSSPAMLFPPGGPKGSNVQQGGLGDCWFISAMVIMATSGASTVEEIFEGSDLELGLIVVRFCKNGRFLHVMIDDRLPTEGSTPIYAKNKDPTIWWCPLWEKAYAKLMGGYANLDGGNIEYALQDFTGMPPMVEDFSGLDLDNIALGSDGAEGSPDRMQATYEALYRTQTGKDAQASYENMGQTGSEEDRVQAKRGMLRYMFNKMTKQRSELGLVELAGLSASGGGSEEDMGMGILAGHAYAITDEWDRGEQLLLKIRNPWGNYGWRGDWSDDCDKWTPSAIAESGYTPGDGGDFYMSLMDVLTTFTQRYSVMMVPPSWPRHAILSSWARGTAGGMNGPDTMKNPQFQFTVTGDSFDAFITLQQEDYRMYGKADETHTIGFSIWKKPDDEDILTQPWQNLVTDISSTNINSRAVTVNLSHMLPAYHLAPGDYIVLAQTFQPNKFGKCCVSMVANEDTNLHQINGTSLCRDTMINGVTHHCEDPEQIRMDVDMANDLRRVRHSY